MFFLLDDDLVTFETALTAASRQKVISWWRSTLVGRVVGGGKIIAIGTPWATDDLLGVLASTGEYAGCRDPAIDAAGGPLWPPCGRSTAWISDGGR